MSTNTPAHTHTHTHTERERERERERGGVFPYTTGWNVIYENLLECSATLFMYFR